MDPALITRLLKNHNDMPISGWFSETRAQTLRDLIHPAGQPKVTIRPEVDEDRFVSDNLEALAHARWFFGKGPKRIRKKQARAHLRLRWARIRSAAFGWAMSDLIRRRLNYTAIGRQILTVERLPDGAMPIYMNPDVDVTQAVIGGDDS